jgi:SAM-dependent methyltransferase
METTFDPALFGETMFAFMRSATLKAAVDLDLFSHVAQGRDTPAELAAAVGTTERAVRIMLDVLAVHGLIAKQHGRYALGPVAEMLLVRSSPAYAGDFTRVAGSRHVWDAVGRLAETARSGEPAAAMVETAGHEFWEEFSEASYGASQLPAGVIAGLLDLDETPAAEVLDVACGSGAYGIAVLARFPDARVTALDWENVLDHTRRFATRAGVGARMTWLAGSAFDVPLPPATYDAILVSHFYHHFSAAENVALTRRLFAALKPGGRLVVHEWVPDDARAEHRLALEFAVVMLATTRAGDAYTLAEYRRMFTAGGFGEPSVHVVPGLGSQVLIVRRPA